MQPCPPCGKLLPERRLQQHVEREITVLEEQTAAAAAAAAGDLDDDDWGWSGREDGCDVAAQQRQQPATSAAWRPLEKPCTGQQQPWQRRQWHPEPAAEHDTGEHD